MARITERNKGSDGRRKREMIQIEGKKKMTDKQDQFKILAIRSYKQKGAALCKRHATYRTLAELRVCVPGSQLPQ